MKRTKVHAFSCIGDYDIETNNNQIISQRSMPKIRQRVGRGFSDYEKDFNNNRTGIC